MKKTIEKAKKALRAGKRATTAAGAFVREEIAHVRRKQHGARSVKQVIAIGLSRARRAGIPLPAPKKGQATARTRRSAQLAVATGQRKRKPRAPSERRSRAVKRTLARAPKSTASRRAPSRQAKSAASRRRKQR